VKNEQKLVKNESSKVSASLKAIVEAKEIVGSCAETIFKHVITPRSNDSLELIRRSTFEFLL
jgi:hypothetical protein